MRRVLPIAAIIGLALAAGGLAYRARSGDAATAPPADTRCLPETGAVEGRVNIPAGRYRIGATPRNPEETGPRAVDIGAFSIDRHEVTNAQFARFVAETGYVTVAERAVDPAAHPGIDPSLLVPGSAVFGVYAGEGFWWRFVPGADWRHPRGPDSSIEGMEHYPVVHIAYEDAAAYAAWAGGELPTEAEWEVAARAGVEGTDYAWGEEFRPDGQWRANTWQGLFPLRDTAEDGHAGLAPVGCYDANRYGLYDMIGNVWEWTASDFDPGGRAGTIRGGSYLCSPDFCARFRPSARQPQERDFSASHIGFRTIVRETRQAAD